MEMDFGTYLRCWVLSTIKWRWRWWWWYLHKTAAATTQSESSSTHKAFKNCEHVYANESAGTPFKRDVHFEFIFCVHSSVFGAQISWNFNWIYWSNSHPTGMSCTVVEAVPHTAGIKDWDNFTVTLQPCDCYSAEAGAPEWMWENECRHSFAEPQTLF